MTELKQSKDQVIMEYYSAWGVFTIPPDIYRRALKPESGPDYLKNWCKLQYEKNKMQSILPKTI